MGVSDNGYAVTDISHCSAAWILVFLSFLGVRITRMALDGVLAELCSSCIPMGKVQGYCWYLTQTPMAGLLHTSPQLAANSCPHPLEN